MRPTPAQSECPQVSRTALVVEADIDNRPQAEAAVQQTVERFEPLDSTAINTGLMLLVLQPEFVMCGVAA